MCFQKTKSLVLNNHRVFYYNKLRQRMAWALNQIFAIAAPEISTKLNTDMQTMYYDIFVRNAFGNYRDILREIS